MIRMLLLAALALACVAPFSPAFAVVPPPGQAFTVGSPAFGFSVLVGGGYIAAIAYQLSAISLRLGIIGGLVMAMAVACAMLFVFGDVALAPS